MTRRTDAMSQPDRRGSDQDADRPVGFCAPGWEACFEADLQRQLDEGATLFGYGEDGPNYAVTKDDKRRVVPGSSGQVFADEDPA